MGYVEADKSCLAIALIPFHDIELVPMYLIVVISIGKISILFSKLDAQFNAF